MAHQTIPIEDLEDILLNLRERPEEPSSTFVVDTHEKAAWAARKILQAKERIARKESQRDRYKATIDTWFQKSVKEDRDSSDFLFALLKPYAAKEIKNLHRGKTLHLPGISLSLRKLPDKALITDEEIVMSYCEAFLPGAVETKKTLSKAAVRDALTGGISVPGAELESGGEELYIKGDSPEQMKKEYHHAA